MSYFTEPAITFADSPAVTAFGRLRISDALPVSDGESNLILGRTIAGVEDVLVLAAQRITGTTEPFYATINWREEY